MASKKEDKTPLQALLELRAKLVKDYKGRSPVKYAGDGSERRPRVPTRFRSLNNLMAGGIPLGTIIEIFGPSDSGKSSISRAIAADIQKQAQPGKDHVLLINFERDQDCEDWWEKLGLDLSAEKFTCVEPDSIEEGGVYIRKFVQTGAVCAVIVDSVFAGVSTAVSSLVGDWEDNPEKHGKIGMDARAWGILWPEVNKILREHDTIIVAINQARENINLGGGKKSWGGVDWNSPRGRALHHAATIRILATGGVLLDEKGEPIKDPDVDGRTVKLKMKKARGKNALGVCKLSLVRGKGFDVVQDLINAAFKKEAIQRSGAYYTIGETRVKGKKELRDLVESSAEVRKFLEEALDSLEEEEAVAESAEDQGEEA